MSYSARNRTWAYDNIAAGSATGKETIAAGSASGVYNTPNENINVGNAQPENLENLITSAGTKAVSVAAAGTEIP